ncbi:MAG: methylmalonyl-CoA mutase family protein [Candidatus Kapabacteria bacterium]|nr:methylmalonyl-CoA mutase family protein [Ignavibacteriota bacterium]MCW5885660.1 methylmalonyl-CoA mutase family protein [Candidatus Kapabacteria bacterium]
MHKIRVVTAAALFDGHDVSVNLFRRLLQKRGAEVVHIGHNRSVKEVVTVALQEDVDAILVSSYQGGHNEYFRYMVDLLKESGAPNILVFGGGGGVILPSEIEALENYGVTRIYHAVDGQKIGIDGIADDIIARITKNIEESRKNIEISEELISANNCENPLTISKQLTVIEDNDDEILRSNLRELYKKYDKNKSLVFGVTGTGGSGKSSLIDEVIGKFLSFTDAKIGVLAVDPSKSTTGGALLGDRIRYNQTFNERVYFRSFATRKSKTEISLGLNDSVLALKSCGYDIIIVETSGIGQGDSNITGISDKSLYVMTSEFGAPSQLEKIDMLDLADFVAINKFEKRGSEDAYREVKIHFLRNRNLKVDKTIPLDELELPVYACSSNQFNNPGVNRLFRDMLNLVRENNPAVNVKEDLISMLPTKFDRYNGLISHDRVSYLSEISETVRNYKNRALEQVQIAKYANSLKTSAEIIENSQIKDEVQKEFDKKYNELSEDSRKFLESWTQVKDDMSREELNYTIMGKEFCINLYTKSLSGSMIPKVALPKYDDWANLLKFYYFENLPGSFPYTAGVFPFKRTTEDPKRQFAGEGSPERTNKRFHYLCANDSAKRLSTAFDGITLYAEDPAVQPDIYGKIGEAGVSICNIDDMNVLMRGFDLIHPLTSVSMTINAPAPIMVAFFFMTAFRRELEKVKSSGKLLTDPEIEQLKIDTFRKIRGTVQADMLKEDQAQNTIIFSIDFAMKMIGDLQEYLSKNRIMNYYSLSISGYHIAEAGANPITQLAFTLANGFTYVEYFLNRGLKVDEFAPNLSFFFSNGMDPEYSVIGRVARRIWAVAMKYRYGANDKSQRLKYHIQTSGRSLHAQEIDFNDIRTTLQGLLAFYDNCNSLHTNSYDEAVTTPTEESVRRSMAIQLILSKEFGMLKNENPNQGSFIIEELTDLVEEAVLMEFNRLSRRGGVLGAMETQYQRSKIQEESMYYEFQKQTGEYPIIGVNTYLNESESNPYESMQVIRTSDDEKRQRINEVNAFKSKNEANLESALDRLRTTALKNGNIFEELLNTVQYATMGQITQVLYEIGGKYRRGM